MRGLDKGFDTCDIVASDFEYSYITTAANDMCKFIVEPHETGLPFWELN